MKAALVEQVGLLMSYCEHYDTGDLKFSKPMATAVRVLLHHQGSSKSILHQLGLRSGRFFTVAPDISPTNMLSECNLVIMRLNSMGAAYIPQLEFRPNQKHRKPFPEWWTGPVAKSQSNKTISRMDIVRSIADMDGGAHIDPAFDKVYHQFRTGAFLGWEFNIEGVGVGLIPSPQYACIRAIAHELLLTLAVYAPWSFSKPYSAEPAK